MFEPAQRRRPSDGFSTFWPEVIAFREVLTLPRSAFLALIVVGVVGRNVVEA